VWKETPAPGAVTPCRRHNCTEVIVVLSGHAEVTDAGETSAFGPDTTRAVAPDVVHLIVSTGDEPVLLVAQLGMARVRVRAGDDDRIPLSWDAPDEVG
jgi:mannose-6-phosphate isomerase-like protein (cupin superfamily)